MNSADVGRRLIRRRKFAKSINESVLADFLNADWADQADVRGFRRVPIRFFPINPPSSAFKNAEIRKPCDVHGYKKCYVETRYPITPTKLLASTGATFF